MFALYDEAVAEAKSKALTLANGERDGLTLRGVDARIYIHCAQMGKITGFPNSFSLFYTLRGLSNKIAKVAGSDLDTCNEKTINRILNQFITRCVELP